MVCVATKTADHVVESQKGTLSPAWLKKELYILCVLEEDSIAQMETMPTGVLEFTNFWNPIGILLLNLGSTCIIIDF